MNETLYISGIVDGTSVDGPGLRTSIYVSGCRHRCPGCHNEHTWPFDVGTPMTVESILQRVADNGMDVTLSGGDPVYSAASLLPLAHGIRRLGFGMWIYTGFTYEELENAGGDVAELLGCADVLVDGPYIAALRDTSLLFRGSSNQRLIDLAATRRNGVITLYNPHFI